MQPRDKIAWRTVTLARSEVLSRCHYLSGAIGALSLAAGSLPRPFATDGRVLGYDPARVLELFADTEALPTHDVLHCTLHCTLMHPFPAGEVDRRFWDLASDICVERIVAALLGPRQGARGLAIGEALAVVDVACAGSISAQRVYRKLAGGNWAESFVEWERLFAADDHGAWYGNRMKVEQPTEGDAGFDPDAQASRDATSGTEEGASVGRESDNDFDEELQDSWKRIARAMKASIEHMPRDLGRHAGVLVEEVEAATRDRIDYAAWLRQFAVMGEHLRLSDEEFDPVFYTFGLRRYGNLPLIEPLEQHEECRIREFVIVIDTSQSVSGDAVHRFVDETCTILASTASFAEQMQVRIIQCDVQVQSDDVIESVEDLRAWGDSVELRGFGGTDFRPAFDYVDELRERGELRNLGGLVYFTDGWGIYPEKRPDYKVAFAFYDEDHRAEDVPPWAVQIVLNEG